MSDLDEAREYAMMIGEDFQTATELAEELAEHFNHTEWLDDSNHWIWDLACEVVQFFRGTP